MFTSQELICHCNRTAVTEAKNDRWRDYDGVHREAEKFDNQTSGVVRMAFWRATRNTTIQL